MKKSLTTAALFLFMVLALVMSGCAPKAKAAVSTTASSGSDKAAMPTSGDVTLVAVSDMSIPFGEIDEEQFLNYPLYMDPKVVDGTMTNSGMDAMFICNVGVPLMEISQNETGLIIVGGGAESYEISEDGLTYTFHLRDFSWEDGVPVTSKQYAYSLMRIMDPNSGSPVSSMLFDIKNAEACVKGEVSIDELGVSTPDDKTLVLTLEKVTPYFIQLTYSPMFTPTREDLIEKFGSKFGTSAESILSNGPFKMTEWVHDSHIVLEKNPKYWNADEVALDRINFKLIRDRQAMMSEFMNHTIDRTSVSSPEWRQKLIAMNEFSYGDYILSGTFSLFMNTAYETDDGVKIFSNAKVRRALAASIDKAEATMMLKGEMAIPATGYIPSELQLDGMNYRDASGYDISKTLPAAVSDPKALLIEGLKELGVEPDPSLYTIEYLVDGTTASVKTEAEYFYETIKTKLGLNLEIIQVERGVARGRRKTGDFGLSHRTSYADYNDPSSFLNGWATYLETHSLETNYDNTEFDKLIDAANYSTDTKERLELFSAAEKLLIETDCIFVPIFHPMSSMMNAGYMKGFINQNYAATQFKTVYTVGRP